MAGAFGLLAGGALGAVLGARSRPAAVGQDGMPTAEVVLGQARDLADRLADGGAIVLPEGDGTDGAGRLAVVRWDPSYVSERGDANDTYGPDGVGHPVLDRSAGLMVLSLVSTHLASRVAFCDRSRWFEDPCHGSRWNGWGNGWAARPREGLTASCRRSGTTAPSSRT